MRRKISYFLIFILFCSSLSGFGPAVAAESDHSADLILKNGDIYTVDKDQSWAETVAIKDGLIVYVGDDKGVKAFEGDDTEVIDLKGKMLTPGLVDTHNHMYAMSEELFWFSLRSYETMEEYLQEIKAYFEETPNLDKIRYGGVGWDQRLVQNYSESNGILPKEILDEVVPDLPVVIIDDDHHTIWVNSKALELAGINKDTPNPQGGVIDRDPETGEPTGILRDFTAIALLVDGLPIPYFTVEQNKAGILAFQEIAAERGTTAVFAPLAGESPHETLLEAFKVLEDEGKLTLRYEIGLWVDESKGTEQIGRFIDLRNKHQGELYSVNSVKIFADDDSDGALTWEQNHLEKTVAALDKEGFRVFVHAFDAGVTATLDAYEYAAEQNGVRDSRHVITHLPSPSKEEVQRLKKLDVIPSPQPGEGWGTKVMKSYFDSKIPVASSSDFPVNDFWHLLGIERGMTITNRDGTPAGESATLDQMIASYTINGANLLFKEDEIGSIEVGKKADFVVLENNLFDIPVEKISDTEILMTIFEGQEVFRHPSFDDKSPTSPFTDIDNDDNKAAILALYEKGIVKGQENFNPRNNITRSQFALMVARALDLKPTKDAGFKDVANIKDEERVAAINALAEVGIVKKGDKFNPNAILTRQQGALMLYRAVSHVAGKEINIGDTSLSYYADGAAVTDPEAKKAFALLYAGKIMTGSPTADGKVMINAGKPLQRTQMAKVLNASLAYMEQN